MVYKFQHKKHHLNYQYPYVNSRNFTKYRLSQTNIYQNRFCMFAKLLSKVKTYSAIFLVCVMAITLLPFEALHTHAVHEHAYAKHNHITQHHCELDELICDQNPDVACEHTHHISTPKHKCFSCTYHFAKQYTLAAELNYTITLVQYNLEHAYFSVSLQKAIIRQSNKGPPAFVTVA